MAAASDARQAAGAGARALGERELARLRWRCRRGMLENDLLLTRFLDRRGTALTCAEATALERLLELPDDALLGVLCAHADANPELRRVAAVLGLS
jgi:antitoxin CptB